MTVTFVPLCIHGFTSSSCFLVLGLCGREALSEFPGMLREQGQAFSGKMMHFRAFPDIFGQNQHNDFASHDFS